MCASCRTSSGPITLRRSGGIRRATWSHSLRCDSNMRSLTAAWSPRTASVRRLSCAGSSIVSSLSGHQTPTASLWEQVNSNHANECAGQRQDPHSNASGRAPRAKPVDRSRSSPCSTTGPYRDSVTRRCVAPIRTWPGKRSPPAVVGGSETDLLEIHMPRAGGQRGPDWA